VEGTGHTVHLGAQLAPGQAALARDDGVAVGHARGRAAEHVAERPRVPRVAAQPVAVMGLIDEIAGERRRPEVASPDAHRSDGGAQGTGHDLGAAVVAVEAGLGDDHAHGALRAHCASASACRMRSPIWMIWARSPGTSFQSKPLPSLFQRGMRCRWKCGTDWKAAAPLAWRMLSPSGLTASRRATATVFAVAMAACRSSTSASQIVGACGRVTTRQCPAFNGLMSMNTSVRSSS